MIKQRRRRRIVAEDEFEPMDTTQMPDEGDGNGAVSVDPEATDLLFETDDVAQLLAEVTGQDVDVTVDDEADTVTFGVGENEFTVEPEGDEEVLESVRIPRRASSVAASNRQTAYKQRCISANSSRQASTRRRVSASSTSNTGRARTSTVRRRTVKCSK